jgi:hypothetical protein
MSEPTESSGLARHCFQRVGFKVRIIKKHSRRWMIKTGKEKYNKIAKIEIK